jgi:hypothetical protein
MSEKLKNEPGDDELRASVVKYGFLSPEIQKSVRRTRFEYAAHFALADEISEAGQRLMYRGTELSAREPIVSPIGTGTLLIVRSASNFQGAVILAERGMTIESRTLVRSCYENSMLIAGLHAFPIETLDHMRADERDSQIGRLTILADEMERNCDPPEVIAKIRDRVSSISSTPKPKKLSTREVAKAVDILPHYLFFRQMSADSAHPTLGALEKHIEFVDGDPVGFGIGQDYAGIPNTLEIGCHAYVSCLAFYARLIRDDGLSAEMDALHQRLVKLAMPPEFLPPS